MSNISLHDRALSHLYRYRFTKQDIEYGAPFEISQDGVATALGISRSHASILLKKMVENGELTTWHSYIRDASRPVKRMVYHITERGKTVYRERAEDLKGQGIDIENIVGESYDEERLTREEKDLLGCICVLNTNLYFNELGSRIPNILCRPTGEVYIKDAIKRRILDRCTESDLQRWHSLAADWCIDHDRSICDRLFHLNQAGRDREAIHILKSGELDISESDISEVSSIIFDLAKRHKDIELMKMAARTSIDSGDLDMAAMIVTSITRYDPVIGSQLMSEILFMRGLYQDSIDLLKRNARKCWESEMITGMCLYGMDRIEEAKDHLEIARLLMLEKGNLSRMDVLLGYEA